MILDKVLIIGIIKKIDIIRGAARKAAPFILPRYDRKMEMLHNMRPVNC